MHLQVICFYKNKLFFSRYNIINIRVNYYMNSRVRRGLSRSQPNGPSENQQRISPVIAPQLSTLRRTRSQNLKYSQPHVGRNNHSEAIFRTSQTCQPDTSDRMRARKSASSGEFGGERQSKWRGKRRNISIEVSS